MNNLSNNVGEIRPQRAHFDTPLTLASEVKQDDFGGWLSVDGWDRAPTSAHTYDNNIFLPKLDRLLIAGGAAYNNGAAYRRQVDSLTRRYTMALRLDSEGVMPGHQR